jgi:SAM-dependent methyltransferase
MSQTKETYTFSGTTAARYFATRTAEKEGAFFLSYLRPGMNLLDCGCGPGSITIGLARRIAPGQVVGVDMDAGQLAETRRAGAEQRVDNIRTEIGSVYKLPFADNSFDAVFAHAVLDHLSDPVAALKEMYRVLKPGGVIGVRTCDYDGNLFAPPDSAPARFWSLFAKLRERNGGNVYIGKAQRGLLHGAGFSRIRTTVTFDLCETAEANRAEGEGAVAFILAQAIVEQFEELGLATRSELERLSAGYAAWGERPDAFHAMSWCEAVGWKA